jgi:hypothetical protein
MNSAEVDTMTDLVRLTVDWTVDADRVAVTYRVVNGGAEPVYVIDGRFRAGPGGTATWSNRLTIGFQVPETAVLGSRLTPLNSRIHSTFSPATFAIRLTPGESHESTLIAPLPLVPDGMTTEQAPAAVVIAGKRVPSRFTDEPPLADHPIVCRVAVFELGVVPHDESLRPMAARLADRDVFRLEKAAWELQRIMSAERRPIEVPMRLPAAVVEKAC